MNPLSSLQITPTKFNYANTKKNIPIPPEKKKVPKVRFRVELLSASSNILKKRHFLPLAKPVDTWLTFSLASTNLLSE